MVRVTPAGALGAVTGAVIGAVIGAVTGAVAVGSLMALPAG
jgi:hypothetical protein